MFRSAMQHQAFRKFLDLYPQIQQLDHVTDQWYHNKTSTEDSELEFAPAYWQSDVLPQITGDGAFTPKRISTLSREFYTTVYGLANEALPVEASELPSTNMHCEREYVAFLSLSTSAMPAVIQPALRKSVSDYSRSIKWIGQYGELECEGEGCVGPDEVKMHVQILPPMQNETGTPSADHETLFVYSTYFLLTPAPLPSLHFFRYTGSCGRQ